MTKLSVVIPAYNEENGIRDILDRVLSVEDALGEVGVEQLEVLVVDDGSKDRTAEITESINGVQLIRHPVNRGYGAALKTGFSAATGELVGFLDADGTYPPEYFPQLCREALNGSDLVIGSRMAGADSEMPATRRLGNWFFASFISLLARQRITDCASGMRVFKKELLEKVYPLPDGLNLTPIMSTRALHEHVKMVEIPIPYRERVGQSKLSVVRDGSIYLQTITWTVLSYNPVRVFGILGLIGVVIAALVGLGFVFARLSGTTELTPWSILALFVALVSGVMGVSIFSLGVSFNYLISLIYKRPIRQGLFGKQIFNPSLDHHFGWIGLVGVTIGGLLALISILLGFNGWDITRIWFYLLTSAMVGLVGMQLIFYWILLRVIEEVSQREVLKGTE